METLLIQLTHQNARNLLLDLESMKIIKSEQPKVPNSQRFRGKLSDKTAEALQAQIAKSREEWDQ